MHPVPLVKSLGIIFKPKKMPWPAGDSLKPQYGATMLGIIPVSTARVLAQVGTFSLMTRFATLSI